MLLKTIFDLFSKVLFNPFNRRNVIFFKLVIGDTKRSRSHEYFASKNIQVSVDLCSWTSIGRFLILKFSQKLSPPHLQKFQNLPLSSSTIHNNPKIPITGNYRPEKKIGGFGYEKTPLYNYRSLDGTLENKDFNCLELKLEEKIPIMRKKYNIRHYNKNFTTVLFSKTKNLGIIL